MLDNAIE